MSDGDNKHLLEIINPQTSLNQDFSTSALLAIGVRQLFLEGQRESCLCIVRFIRASLPSTQQIPVASGPFPLLVTIRNIGRHCQVSPLAMAPQMGTGAVNPLNWPKWLNPLYQRSALHLCLKTVQRPLHFKSRSAPVWDVLSLPLIASKTNDEV